MKNSVKNTETECIALRRKCRKEYFHKITNNKIVTNNIFFFHKVLSIYSFIQSRLAVSKGFPFYR